MKVKTEIIAGATTFLTMSYILAVNPSILSSTGMDKGALFTGTALAAAISTLLLAFMAKLPAQAPSMGLNAFFAYSLCQAMGYMAAIACDHACRRYCLILITFFNVRELILEKYSQEHAIRHFCSGIGMFIAFIGLKMQISSLLRQGTFVGLGSFTRLVFSASSLFC